MHGFQCVWAYFSVVEKYYIIKLKRKQRSLCSYWTLTKVILVSGQGKTIRYKKAQTCLRRGIYKFTQY